MIPTTKATLAMTTTIRKIRVTVETTGRTIKQQQQKLKQQWQQLSHSSDHQDRNNKQ